MIGMTTAKIAVTVPEDVLRRARGAVRRGEARSLSAYVTAALEEKTTLAELELMLDEMLASTGGPLTRAEEQRADRVLYGPGGRKKARARR
jgi:Arc/MetJ-type ribon-helix-helix transcriptional regulator